MAVGPRVRSNVWVVGSQAFLHSFFSTVAHRLEPEGWGSQFPAVQHELYRGEISADRVATARSELATIQEQLKQFPPTDAIWDIEDPSARPPWGEDISPDITSLSNYFVTSDGRDLFEVFFEVISYAGRVETGIKVEGGV
ncbi:MAG TPA: immunity 70 family protein [Thermoleophilaceae bacterium]|nr:immunity 70 family protein [Thermoleophilaceae bacterium]